MIKLKSINSYTQVLIWTTYVFYLFSIVAFGDRSEYYKISNLLFVVLIGLMCLRLGKKVLYIKHSFLAFFPFAIFAFVSLIWSYDFDATMERSFTVLKLLVLLVIMATYLYQTGEIRDYINGIAIASILVLVYVFAFYGVSALKAMLAEGVRVGDDFVNSNTLAMFLSLGAIILLARYLEKKNIAFFLFYIVLVLTIALTGSKKGLIDIVLGSLLIMTFYQKKEDRYKFLKWIIRILFIIVGLYIVWNQPIFATVRYRMEIMIGTFLKTNTQSQIDYSTLQRQALIEAGIAQFKKTPILGVGINASGFIGRLAISSNTYLHNNYIELLATGGIIGTALYYCPVVKMIINSFRLRDVSDELKLCIVFLLIQCINDTGAVQFGLKFTYIVFAICLASLSKAKDEPEI